MPFASKIGLFALLSLIPFIILYMRRPKPQDRVIPSLMFLVKEKKQSNKYSFLKKFLYNLIFFMQLISIAGLSLTVASPYLNLNYDVSLENTIIILDSSASMQAEESGETRFDQAVKEASKHTSGKNTIIMAENIPLVVLEEEDEETAEKILSSLKPKSTTTNLGDAILLARDLLGDKPGRIVVISDFANINFEDLLLIKRSVESEERIVNFIEVSNTAENVGIIDLTLYKHSMKAYIKNFNSKEKNIKLKLKQSNNIIADSGNIKILPNSIESFSFDDVPTGTSTLELEPKDSFPLDDISYISAPLKKQISVLLITNKKNTNLETALKASKDISLNVVNPPVLTINTNGEKIEPYKHEVIITHYINNINKKDGILPGTFQDLSSYVKNGGNLAITAQPDSNEINVYDTNVVNIGKKIDEGKKICSNVINQITKDLEHCFASTGSYFDSSPAIGSLTMASIGDTPIFSLKGLNKGKVFYYGIIDESSDFKTLPSYPIFWNKLINFLAESEDINDFNFKTGKALTIEKQKVKTPSTSLTTTKLLFDETGFYEFNQRKYASNLHDSTESDINIRNGLEEQKSSLQLLKEQSRQKEFNLDILILIAVFLILCFEVIYIKRRGDI